MLCGTHRHRGFANEQAEIHLHPVDLWVPLALLTKNDGFIRLCLIIHLCSRRQRFSLIWHGNSGCIGRRCGAGASLLRQQPLSRMVLSLQVQV